MRNCVRITHDNQLVAAVGGLIRRMDVRKGIGDIAAALVKALTADGCVIDKRIDSRMIVLFCLASSARISVPRP